MAMKYICYDNGLLDVIIVFPDMIDHNDMRCRLNVPIENVLSAGFVAAENENGPSCYGMSVSLKVESRPVIDTKILRKFLG